MYTEEKQRNVFDKARKASRHVERKQVVKAKNFYFYSFPPWLRAYDGKLRPGVDANLSMEIRGREK